MFPAWVHKLCIVLCATFMIVSFVRHDTAGFIMNAFAMLLNGAALGMLAGKE